MLLNNQAISEKAANAALDMIYQDGAPVYATKEIMYGGKKLQPGEQVNLVGGKWDRQLIEQGTFVPEATWLRMKEEQAAEQYHRDVYKPARQALEDARAADLAAEQALEAAKAHKKQAADFLKIAQVQFDQAAERAPALLKQRLNQRS